MLSRLCLGGAKEYWVKRNLSPQYLPKHVYELNLVGIHNRNKSLANDGPISVYKNGSRLVRIQSHGFTLHKTFFSFFI